MFIKGQTFFGRLMRRPKEDIKAMGAEHMYKKAITGIILFYMTFFFGYLSVEGVNLSRQISVSADTPAKEIRLDERVMAKKQESTIGIVDTAISGQRTLAFERVENDHKVSLGAEETELLNRIVEAEAGNQDEDGRLLVANVVLNRVASEKFPDSVKEVILQETNGSYQFSPVANGRIWRVKISDETAQAVERALSGEDISDGALYFVARQYADGSKVKWFDNHLTYLFEWGGHEFFK